VSAAVPASLPQPADVAFEARVRKRFADQNFMQTINAEMTEVSAGRVVIELPFQTRLTQHHGYIHAGIITSIADTACGYAAMTLMPRDTDVLSVEFKLNLLSPAEGQRLIARAAVKRAGRTLTICTCEVASVRDGEEKAVAFMLATMISVGARVPRSELS
jgi:uncharacterized protein (TIGR00369 family)